MSEGFGARQRPGELVGHLDDVELARLLSATEVAEVEPGAVILHRGAPSRSLILVESGEVEVVDETGAALAVIGPGGVVGEVGFVDGKSRINDVRARSLCALRRLTRERLMAMAAAEPLIVGKIMLGLAEILAGRFRALAEELSPVRAFAATLSEPEEGPAFDEIDEPLPAQSEAVEMLRQVAGRASRGLAGM